MFTTTCPHCHGEGSLIGQACPKCNGGGQVEKTRKVLVTFPAGIDSNQRLRIPGQGLPGMMGGPNGDLYVDVEIEPDERFEREGADLITRVNVSYADAAMGTNVTLTLFDDSELKVDVPAGIQPGEVISVKGRGAPRIDGRGRGALHVQVQVEVPRRLTARARELLTELNQELQGGSSSSKKRANAG
jgi:molecular chaperone DnaJ